MDRIRNMVRAMDELQDRFGRVRQSGVYESDPVGFEGDPFLNAVVLVASDKSPRDLVSIFRSIENECGRRRTAPRLGPRTLDLDLLLYDDLVIDGDGLVIPRHEIGKYAFVLRPLAELAGDRWHPVTGETYADMWSRFNDAGQKTRRIAASIGELSANDRAGPARRLRPGRAAQPGGADG